MPPDIQHPCLTIYIASYETCGRPELPGTTASRAVPIEEISVTPEPDEEGFRRTQHPDAAVREGPEV